MSTDRVGPFEVVREVTRAPGLTLVEARDPDGQRRLLQLARFRAPLDDEERGARQHHEKQIARQTMELMTASSDVVVHAHGGADATDGERFLFWALPWGESPLLVERAALGVDELIAIGIGLARRMARRHADGMVEPILTEHVLRMDEMGTIQVVAIPVSIDEEWRSAATPAMRFAPEETSPEGVVPSGDIWRLGRLLLALGDKTTLPKRVREGIERLAAANPDDRPKNAHEARLLLERVGAPVHTAGSAGVDTGETAMTAPSPLDPLAVTSWVTPADRQWTEPGEEASRPVDVPNFERSTDRLLARVTPPVPASEMVTSQASPLEVHVGLPTVQDARVPTTDPASLHTDPEGEPASDELMDLSDDVVLVAEGAPDFSSSTTLRDQPAHDSSDTAPTNGAPAALLADVSETTVRLDVTASNESAEATPAAQSAEEVPQSTESVASADVTTDAAGELASSTGAEIDTQVGSSSKSVAATNGDEESVEAKFVAPPDDAVNLAASDGRDSESVAATAADSESVASTAADSESVASTAAASESVASTAAASESVASTDADSESVASTAAASESVAATVADSESVAATVAESESVAAAAADSESVAAAAADSESVAAAAADSESVAAAAADSESVAAAAADSESVAAAAADSESVAATAAESESVAAAAAESESVAAAAAESESVAAAAAESESVAATDADAESLAATDADAESLAAIAADSESVAAAAADAESVVATDADSESVAAIAADSESLAAIAAESKSVAATDADSESMATAGEAPRDVAETVQVLEASTSIETAADVTSDPPSDPASDRDPLAAAWEQPVLPPGESPWSEVVSTRGAHHRAHEEFPGLRGEVPVGPIGGPAPQPAVEVSSPTPLPYVAPGGDDVDMELIDAISGFDWRKMAAGAVVVLVIFGLFALIARSGGEADNTDVVVAPSTNEFKLQSKPSGATVVAVRDGHVLGKTPLEFLVPNRSRVQVILVADGYEPLRLDLPERGGLTVELSKRSAKPCEVTITGVDNARLEGIGFEAGEGHRLTIPGAGVVRVADGQRVVGASIVYCPALGGNATEALAVRPRSNPAAVRLTEPAGAAAYIDGEPIGRVPTVARVEAAFAHVRVDDASGMSEERWVPTGDNIEVRMPTPKPRKIPVLLVPDGLPKPAASAPPTEDDADDDETSEATAVEPATVADDAPRRRGPRLTRAQRRARARRYLDEGTRAMVSDCPKTARSKFRACIRMDPSNAECHRELGTVYRRLRRPQASRQYYLKYLELRPDARDAATIRRLLR